MALVLDAGSADEALRALEQAGQPALGHRRGRGRRRGSGSDERRADAFAALRDHLLAHSVKTGDFTLKSGRKSSWFIDSKQTVCRPEAMLLVADAVLSVIPDDATAIGGLTMGADPVAFVTAGVAATRGRPLKAFSVRKEAKDHGGGGRIAGALDPGDKVVVTEDTVTRGTSLLEAAHAVQEAGGRGGAAGGGGGPRRHGRGDGGGRGDPVPRHPHRARPRLPLRGGLTRSTRRSEERDGVDR